MEIGINILNKNRIDNIFSLILLGSKIIVTPPFIPIVKVYYYESNLLTIKKHRAETLCFLIDGCVTL